MTVRSVVHSQGRRVVQQSESTGARICEYVGIGQDPVAVIEGGVVYLIRADHIGWPLFATTLAGTKVWSAVHLPFGGGHVTTCTPIDARFPGQNDHHIAPESVRAAVLGLDEMSPVSERRWQQMATTKGPPEGGPL